MILFEFTELDWSGRVPFKYHWYMRGPAPVAVTEQVTVAPAAPNELVGWAVITGKVWANALPVNSPRTVTAAKITAILSVLRIFIQVGLAKIQMRPIKLEFPIWRFARDPRGLYFQILNPLRFLASIFHFLLEAMRSISYSEAPRAPFWTTNTPFLERLLKGFFL